MTRDKYEQQEFQRKNPHLFTTLTQSVNADGSITTYQQVTKKLQETYDRILEIVEGMAIERGMEPHQWIHIEELQPQAEQLDYLTGQMKIVARGFADTYARFQEDKRYRLESLKTTSPTNNNER